MRVDSVAGDDRPVASLIPTTHAALDDGVVAAFAFEDFAEAPEVSFSRIVVGGVGHDLVPVPTARKS
eukprot:8617380-Lingulodinium_polyedra.AAC.1